MRMLEGSSNGLNLMEPATQILELNGCHLVQDRNFKVQTGCVSPEEKGIWCIKIAKQTNLAQAYYQLPYRSATL